MKSVMRRVRRLAPRPKELLILSTAGQKLAFDKDRCIQILREAGHLNTQC
jgi:hypothetical protein